jgi:L-alanine-DL-glutamate epimerase-like enolase superfamily enzyme
MKKITIEKVNNNFEREKLTRPFGFKGGYLSELWQTIAYMESSTGNAGLGLGTQSVLWSDAQVFTTHSESAGNVLMYSIMDFALNEVKGTNFASPIDLLRQILPGAYRYAKKVTNRPDLRLTFVLNALVGFDNAAWMLYGRENGLTGYDDLIGKEFNSVLSHRQDKLCCIPLIAYGVPIDQVRDLAQNGYFFLKIKIGSDPDKDGDRVKMLEWDKNRLTQIHQAVAGIETPYTNNGKIAYYLDANGRYDSKDRLRQFLDHAKKIGAFDQIILLEEPFPEEFHENVSDLGVTIAADESAHSDKDAKERIDLGYGAIALKPIAKTMSMSLKIAKLAKKAKVPCYCADLTVNPILVDWNKCFAARLPALPGLKIGAFETNGDQNYKIWDTLQSYHPSAGKPWTKPQAGLFTLDTDFYQSSGGILTPSEHYLSLVK